ncbi:MAG: ABC transporter substrate-binding protein [Kosmotoga sp.]|uniref:ABC transporter substrate-binding protein n=1 Tax=Kosmotoga sp. TaxID=1955248 RepID=UPI0025BF6DC5|nr:ABC transporter substrate-binding protein [Kosmotoga sp.]MCD6159682.1 ABC transporter substrate-binding protein [Kosmotoga sp.]
MKKLLVLLVIFAFSVSALAVINIKISGWPGNPIEEGVIKSIVEKFNETHSDIQVEWTPIPGDFRQMIITQFSAGTAPDIFYVDTFWFEEMARQNMLLPLDLYIKRDNFDIDDFYPSLVQAFSYKGRIYGIPKDFSTLALYYNKEIFDKYGVEYPTSEDTWFDFLDKALQLKRKGFETPLVLAPDFNRLIPFVIAANGELVKGDLNTGLTEPNSRFAIQFYLDLVNKYKVAQEPANLGAGWIGEAFGKEAVAMAMTGPWTLGYLRGQYPDVVDKTGIVEMPHLINHATMVYTVSWSINRNTRNRDAAWEVVKFLTKEGQKMFVEGAGVLASRKSIAAADTDPMKEAFYAGAAYAIPWRVPTPSGIFSKANDQINSKLKDLFYDKISLEQALNEIQTNYMSWVSE